MRCRDFFSLSTVALVALTVGVGCPDDTSKGPAPGSKPTTTAATTATATATATAKAAAMGTAVIKGVVSFTGTAPEMKVPKKRKEHEVCKEKDVPYNAVVVKDGKLKDVLVRIEVGGVKGDWKAPEKHGEIDQVDCMYEPRIQGVVSGQELDIKNGDATLHNVHTYKGTESWFNQGQPKQSPAITKELEEGVIKFACDVHPWMRGYVVVTDHPFFAVTGDDGAFTIEKVPAGKYNVEAWHSRYGSKKAEVTVEDGKTVETTFSYDGKEPEPDIAKDELKDLF